MVSYPNKRCGLHPGKKLPLIWLGHGRSKSMVNKLNSMHQLVLIRLQIQLNWSVMIIRQLNTYVTSSLKIGFVDTLVLYDAYMTREVNSLDKTFNGSWKCLGLKMYAQPAKIHKNNVLRTLIHNNPPTNRTQAWNIIDDALATAIHAMWTTIATTIGSTPGALAFARDMFLNVPLIADWHATASTHEHHVNENLWCANRKQSQFDYAPGQQVPKKVHNPTKLGVRMEGPYTIEHIHVNSNLTILLREGITELINIRRVLPYCWPFHIPLWRQILAWIVFELFTFNRLSFFLHLTFKWAVGGVF